mmetsp:Transcript_10244/g.20067  ORF Transcript_10244/g.20067 Transcript_10244/m.20067 type:complete len:335 (+) Transcript_10244:94-1098(+)|eukprot:CAMPEP_0171567058 /NCGR_PEP_ID=MMETSP0961-20121227/935_1 /TAXON_ID=87120 /ORGANISM="Aurantiochytrium limacinum, Strain ATCCMYA-1381" /LENGTH=334 /DNA_ID=CAMNT_0012120909 /DNA_START=31 /DNA_END=1035 /DNA_ORIENTATION=-
MSVEEQLVDLLLNQLGDLVQYVTEVPLKVRLVLGSILLVILALTFLFGQPWPSAAQRAGKRFHDAPRRILVTGAASEIGKQLCAALLAKGHRIIATDRDYRALKALTAQDEGWRNASANLRIKPLNVTQASDWESTMRYAEHWLEGVDVVINLAGVFQPGLLHELGELNIDEQIDVNFKGAVLGTLLASLQMEKQESTDRLPIGGHIINFAGLDALAFTSGSSIYSGSKHAVRGFSLSAAKELAPKDIFVTLVSPDSIISAASAQVGEGQFMYERPSLKPDVLNQVILEKVLRYRPREVIIAASLHRQVLVSLLRRFPASRLASYYERHFEYSQ